jgi:RNA polymerase sigma-70 factor (ECF subfamily)
VPIRLASIVETHNSDSEITRTRFRNLTVFSSVRQGNRRLAVLLNGEDSDMVSANATSNESQLLAAAAGGDSDAFGQLFLAYRDRLITAVIGIVRCRSDAEDVVQEAFMQAYIKLNTFKARSTFYTWIYRIAVNTALSHGRRQRVRTSLENTRDLMGEEPEDPSGAPSERMMRDEHAAAIQGAFASLSQDYRTILMLRGVEGHDYDTIAKTLKLKPGTVRSRLHRARTELREQLDDAMYCHA